MKLLRADAHADFVMALRLQGRVFEREVAEVRVAIASSLARRRIR
jgi:hypothetical protein